MSWSSLAVLLAGLLGASIPLAGASTTTILLAGTPAAPRPRITDDTGAELELAAPPHRIVSLAPGATEMLFAIGAGARVVGTSRYSDEPAAARTIPRVGDVAGLDYERILALKPDVVIVWKGGNPAAQIEQLRKLGLPLYRQQVASLRDLPVSLRRLGALTGEREIASRAADALGTRLEALRLRYAARPRLRVFLQIWDRPLYTTGARHLMSDALRICGADTVFPELGGDAPAVSTEAVLQRDPDVIVADAPPGRAAAWLAQWRRFPQLRAVRTRALVAFEDPRFGMLGPSAIDSTGELCRRLDALRQPA